MGTAPYDMCDADDVEDRRELAEARADDDYVSWDVVKAALGLG